ncbi:hypothetical protein C7I87_27810 [Mesorhizobium sp. SARCC-RB16n]|nr:hypothetical protein C7I87_27810 [Mesorhizobium sp. SARCC-RB16n]
MTLIACNSRTAVSRVISATSSTTFGHGNAAGYYLLKHQSHQDPNIWVSITCEATPLSRVSIARW